MPYCLEAVGLLVCPQPTGLSQGTGMCRSDRPCSCGSWEAGVQELRGEDQSDEEVDSGCQGGSPPSPQRDRTAGGFRKWGRRRGEF